jgi:hypothetical protein
MARRGPPPLVSLGFNAARRVLPFSLCSFDTFEQQRVSRPSPPLVRSIRGFPTHHNLPRSKRKLEDFLPMTSFTQIARRRDTGTGGRVYRVRGRPNPFFRRVEGGIPSTCHNPFFRRVEGGIPSQRVIILSFDALRGESPLNVSNPFLSTR